MNRQIFAIGGGGFSTAEELTPLEHYLLKLSRRREKPKVCFISTASGDSDLYQLKFYRSFSQINCSPIHLSLFSVPENLEQLVLDQDIVYVGGGNTFNLLTLWRAWSLDQALIKAYEQGVVLAGVSAGSLCWFNEGLSDSFGKKLKRLGPCLGILKHSNCPHYSATTSRRDSYLEAIREDELKAGYACKDNTALHFVNEELKSGVGYGLDYGAFYVSKVNGIVNEDEVACIDCSVITNL